MEGSVSKRIVLGFGCSVAGNGARRERGPGLWGLGIALRGGFCMFFPFLFLFYFFFLFPSLVLTFKVQEMVGY